MNPIFPTYFSQIVHGQWSAGQVLTVQLCNYDHVPYVTM